MYLVLFVASVSVSVDGSKNLNKIRIIAICVAERAILKIEIRVESLTVRAGVQTLEATCARSTADKITALPNSTHLEGLIEQM